MPLRIFDCLRLLHEFYIKDRCEKGYIEVVCKPIIDMIAYVLTKPPHGLKDLHHSFQISQYLRKHMLQMIAAAHKRFKQAEECDSNDAAGRRDLYVIAAKSYFNAAKSINDKTMQASLLYLAALSINKAEETSANKPTQSINMTPIPPPEQIDSISGRLTSFDRNTLAPMIDTSPPPEKSFKHHANDLVTDLLVLENKLNEIGLMKSDSRTIRRTANIIDSPATTNDKGDIGNGSSMESPFAGYSSYSRLQSDLGESFMILSTANTMAGIRDQQLRPTIGAASLSGIQPPPNTDHRMSSLTATHAAISNGMNNNSKANSDDSNPYGNDKKPVAATTVPTIGMSSMTGLFGSLSWGHNQSDKHQHTPTLLIPRHTPSIGELNMGYMPQFSTDSETESGTGRRPISLNNALHRPSAAATDRPILEDPTINKDIASVSSSAYGMTSLAALDMTSEGNQVNSETSISQLSDSLASEIRELLTQPSTSQAPNQKANIRYPSYPADQSAGILKLLDTIKTLSNENTKLEDRLKHLTLVEQQNFALRREMDNFKADYIRRFAKLKQSLNEFAELHPHPANPANAYACKVTSAASTVPSTSNRSDSPSPLDDKTLLSVNNEVGDEPELRQAQLEKTVCGLLARLEATTSSLEQAKIEAEKKSRLVVKYEAYYKELRKSVEKREQERKISISKASTNNTTPTSVTADSGNTQSSRVIREPQYAAGTTTLVQGSDTEPQFTQNSTASSSSNVPSTSPANIPLRQSVINNSNASAPPTTTFASVPIAALTNTVLIPRHKNPTTSTLEASLQRSAALEKKDRRR